MCAFGGVMPASGSQQLSSCLLVVSAKSLNME